MLRQGCSGDTGCLCDHAELTLNSSLLQRKPEKVRRYAIGPGKQTTSDLPGFGASSKSPKVCWQAHGAT